MADRCTKYIHECCAFGCRKQWPKSMVTFEADPLRNLKTNAQQDPRIIPNPDCAHIHTLCHAGKLLFEFFFRPPNTTTYYIWKALKRDPHILLLQNAALPHSGKLGARPIWAKQCCWTHDKMMQDRYAEPATHENGSKPIFAKIRGHIYQPSYCRAHRVPRFWRQIHM